MKKIGILGGTFNPIHKGHLNIATCAYTYLRLDEVWFLPAGTPPHKDVASHVSFLHRKNMVASAIADEPHFKLCSMELEKKTPCYSWETLQNLKKQYGEQYEFYFIIGEDSFAMFDQWVHPKRICACCRIVIARRPLEHVCTKDVHPMSFEERLLAYREQFATDFIEMPVEEMDISSSYIRQCIHDHMVEDIRSMLPPNVFTYIDEHQLYQKDASMNCINSLQKKMAKELKPERFEHTLGVMYTAGNMAFAHGFPVKKAMLAGLLHDCAKCMSDEKRLEICNKHDIPITEIEYRHPHLLHGKVGAYLAKHKYEIDDIQIQHAIAVHTTGCPHMNLLDKIIYISDYIEPHRDKAPHLEEIRHMAYTDIDRCLFMILEDSVAYLSSMPQDMDPLTLETYNYYKECFLQNDVTKQESIR